MRFLTMALLALATATAALAGDTFTPGAFKLYGEPHHAIDASCDHGTKLDLRIRNGAYTGSLENFLEGTCEIFIEPDPRSISIAKVKDDGCGSTVLIGSYEGTDGHHDVTIVDNAGRRCENVIAARVEVTDKGPHGVARMYTSY